MWRSSRVRDRGTLPNILTFRSTNARATPCRQHRDSGLVHALSVFLTAAAVTNPAVHDTGARLPKVLTFAKTRRACSV
ncbi:hypothetical protein B0G76_3519 [Paraburkholderia sp. BL23I1N1]|nr:hypothetical protein B0G76_3519 [Paraburkholderia sp. BL23I1N1]